MRTTKVLGCLLAAGSLLAPFSRAAAAEAPHRVSGPYVHDNLQVYLVHGPAPQKARRLLTLDRALSEKKVIVRETGNVSQLTIENVSDAEVYVQAGEIVKGGQQDRVLGTDLLLPPKSGRVPLPSHCVESGRWRQRGHEAVASFSSSANALSHKDLKLANYAGSQQGVWSNVDKVQRLLETRVGAGVRAPQSRSSLQLTLENGQVSRRAADYERALASLVRNHPDAVGFAFAINGELNSADVYASRPLFAALWPKLLRATVTEAIAEGPAPKRRVPPSLTDVRSLLDPADSGALTEKAPNPRTRSFARETTDRLVVETRETAGRQSWVHRSYVKK